MVGLVVEASALIHLIDVDFRGSTVACLTIKAKRLFLATLSPEAVMELVMALSVRV